jgi:hypothetical protein
MCRWGFCGREKAGRSVRLLWIGKVPSRLSFGRDSQPLECLGIFVDGGGRRYENSGA